MSHSSLPPIRLCLFVGFSWLSHGLNAAELQSSDGAASDSFGNSAAWAPFPSCSPAGDAAKRLRGNGRDAKGLLWSFRDLRTGIT
jgi:hypothetical protein